MSHINVSEQENNIKFVQTVQKYPVLYNFDLPTYSRKDLSDQAWEDIAKAMDMTPSACRERWRNLRAVFVRTIKTPRKGGGKKKPYYLSEVLQFVLPYMRPLQDNTDNTETCRNVTTADQTTSEIENYQVVYELDSVKLERLSDEDLTIEDERLTGKRPYQDIEYTVHETPPTSTSIVTSDNDPVKSFLDSLVPELIEMSSGQFNKFKRRVLLLIDDITEETSKRGT